jgi:hypothetical protein
VTKVPARAISDSGNAKHDSVREDQEFHPEPRAFSGDHLEHALGELAPQSRIGRTEISDGLCIELERSSVTCRRSSGP